MRIYFYFMLRVSHYKSWSKKKSIENFTLRKRGKWKVTRKEPKCIYKSLNSSILCMSNTLEHVLNNGFGNQYHNFS